jgi:ABC-type oligopeptide transport system substrate-binding subunit
MSKKSLHRLPGLLILAFLFGGACSPAPPPAGDKTLVVALEANPTNLDPRHATGATAVRIIPLLFDSLVTLDPAGEIVPAVAESWDKTIPPRRSTDFISSGGYTFMTERNLLRLT